MDFFDETEEALYNASELIAVDLKHSIKLNEGDNPSRIKDIKSYDVIVFMRHDSYKSYIITDAFRDAVLKLNPNLSKEVSIVHNFALKNNIKYFPCKFIKLTNINDDDPKLSSGGKKAVVKHTVKQLQAIASKNNIKITKKVDGKTVRLNKQGLIAKLKRYKLI